MPLDQTTREAVSPDTKAMFIRLYRQQRRVCEEAQGKLRSILKDAKGHGINTKAMIQGVAFTKIEPDEVRSELRDVIEIVQLLRIEVSQSDLFEGMDLRVTEKTVREDDVWEADDAGYRAGRYGARVEDCKYPAGTELHVHWLAAWHKGQASIAHELGPNVKPASTSKARPKREQAKLDVEVPETVTLIDEEADDKPARRARKASNPPRARKSTTDGSEAAALPH